MSLYNYIPNNWNGNNGSQINDESLNKIENGIKYGHERLNSIDTEITKSTSDIESMGDSIITTDGKVTTLKNFMDKFNLNGVNGQVLTLQNGNIILQSPESGSTSIGNISQWEANKLYDSGTSTVIYNNGSFYGFYLCKITNSEPIFTISNWNLIGETGFIGAETTNILKNKTIDTSNNTITNIGLNNFVSGLLETDNTLGSNSNVHFSSVKAVREFVENKLSGLMGGLTRKGSLDASLGMLPSNVSEGNYWIVSNGGNVGVRLNVGDYLIANQTVSGSTNVSDWNVIPNILSSDVLKLTDIIDSLISTDASKVLSANQGRVLKAILDSMDTLKADKVLTPITDNLLSMDSTGNLKDSGSKVADFETPTGSQLKVDNSIIAIKNGVSTDGDTLLKLRTLITGIQTLLNSNDVNLDSLQEIVSYIKDNKTLIDGITTTKVNISDIVNNLTSTDINKPSSANMAKTLNDSIVALQTQVDNLPTTSNIKVDKIGVLKGERSELNFIEGSNITLDINDDTVDGRVDIKINSTATGGDTTFGNYTTTYTYDTNGKISGCTIIGDKSETTIYEYYTSGDNLGKINTEAIQKDSKTITNTFSYTNGKISEVSTITT